MQKKRKDDGKRLSIETEPEPEAIKNEDDLLVFALAD